MNNPAGLHLRNANEYPNYWVHFSPGNTAWAYGPDNYGSKVSMSRIEREYTYVIVGFSGIVIQEITIRLIPALSKVVKNPNLLTSLNILNT